MLRPRSARNGSSASVPKAGFPASAPDGTIHWNGPAKEGSYRQVPAQDSRFPALTPACAGGPLALQNCAPFIAKPCVVIQMQAGMRLPLPVLEFSRMVSLALLRVIALFLLVAANDFFVAAEFALVSVRDTRIQQLIEARRLGARTVRRLQQNLDQLLSAVQFGVTLTSLGLGWVGEATLAGLLEPLFRGVPYAGLYAHGIAITLAFAGITFLHVTLGELVPKSVALERAERVALAVSGPMEVFMTISKPALYLFSRSARLVLRIFGLRHLREGGVHSPEELKLIVTASRRVGLLPPLQEETIHRTLELGDVTVREVMIPRTNIFPLPADMPLDDALDRVVQDQHS